MISKEAITQLVEEWITDHPHFFLVELKLSSDAHIHIEIEATTGSVNIDDCCQLSQFIESKLDRETDDFSLEVMSAGIGQAFKVPQQFHKHLGKEVEVRLRNGSKLVGTLKEVNPDDFCVSVLRRIKPEGAKRPIQQEMEERYRYDETNSVCYHLVF